MAIATPTDAAPLVIRLFGEFEARLHGERITGLQVREGERLLAYLTLQGGKPVSYRELAERFWPGEARSTFGLSGDFQSTRQAIRSLRVALGDEAHRLKSVERSVVTLDLEETPGVMVDLGVFDRLASLEDEASWREAAALYRGPLLERWNDTWITDTRVRRKRTYERMLRELIVRAKEKGDASAEEDLLRRLLDSVVHEEDVWRALMEVQARRGNLARMEETFESLRDLLARDGKNPEEETGLLRQALRRGVGPAPTAAPVPAVAAISWQTASPVVHSTVDLDPSGGAVNLDSKFYISRPADTEFHTAIRRPESVVLVKGARQMGKTSLLARGLEQARQTGARVILSDMQALNASQLASAESLFLALATNIAVQLDLDALPKKEWDADLGPSMNLEIFIRRKLLAGASSQVVWGLDEVDRLFAYPFATELFGLFRSWHNRRSLEPSGPWGRLTLAIAYATEAHLFITDVNQSPFNVGTRVPLDDFTLEQVEQLNIRYGGLLQGVEEVKRLHGLLSGQPYLTRQALDEMARGMSLDTLEETAERDDGPFGNHLRRLLVLLTHDPALTEAVRRVLEGGPCPSMDLFFRLRSAGVMSGEWGGAMRLRCRLYAGYLLRHLQ